MLEDHELAEPPDPFQVVDAADPTAEPSIARIPLQTELPVVPNVLELAEQPPDPFQQTLRIPLPNLVSPG